MRTLLVLAVVIVAGIFEIFIRLGHIKDIYAYSVRYVKQFKVV